MNIKFIPVITSTFFLSFSLGISYASDKNNDEPTVKRLMAFDQAPQDHASRVESQRKDLIQKHVLPLIAAAGFVTDERTWGGGVLERFQAFEDLSLIPVVCDALTSYYASQEKPNYALLLWDNLQALEKLKTREMVEAVCDAIRMNDLGGPLSNENKVVLFSTEMHLYEIEGIIKSFGKLQDPQKIRRMGQALCTFRTFLFTPARDSMHAISFMIADASAGLKGLNSLTSNALFGDVHAFLQNNSHIFFPSEMPGTDRAPVIAALCNLKDKGYLEAIKGVIESLGFKETSKSAPLCSIVIQELGMIDNPATLLSKCEAIKPYKQRLHFFLQPREADYFFERVACELLSLENEDVIKDVCEGVLTHLTSLLGLCKDSRAGFWDMDSGEKASIIEGLIRLKSSAAIKEATESIVGLGEFTPKTLEINNATTFGDLRQQVLAYEDASSFVKKYRNDRRAAVINALLKLKSAEQILTIYQALKTHAPEYINDPERYEFIIALILYNDVNLMAKICEAIRVLPVAKGGRHSEFYGREELIYSVGGNGLYSRDEVLSYPRGVRGVCAAIMAHKGSSVFPEGLTTIEGHTLVKRLIEMNDEVSIYRTCAGIKAYMDSGNPSINKIFTRWQLVELKDFPTMARMRSAVQPVLEFMQSPQIKDETRRRIAENLMGLSAPIEDFRVSLDWFLTSLSRVDICWQAFSQSLGKGLKSFKGKAKELVQDIQLLEKDPQSGTKLIRRDAKDLLLIMDEVTDGLTTAAKEAFMRDDMDPALSPDDRIRLKSSLDRLLTNLSALNAALKPKLRTFDTDGFESGAVKVMQNEFAAYTLAAILMEHQMLWPQ